MYEIVEQYNFVATHEIKGLQSTHPCHGVHMHQWSVEVVLLATGLPPNDELSETALLEPLRRYVTSELEGSHLNDVLLGDPTPARIAGHLSNWGRVHLAKYALDALHSIVVSAARASRGRCRLTRNQLDVR
jgi:6-pyruvoyl-tetrahydropterin synthase